jgi:hypothetical protein
MNSTASMSSQQGGGEASGGGASFAKPVAMSHAASAKGSGMGRAAKRTPQKSSGGSSNNSFQIVHAHVVTCTLYTQHVI